MKEDQTFQDNLEIQKASFMSQCRILLESIMGYDTAIRMLLASSRDPLCQNKDLEGRLGANLSDPKVTFVISIKLITEKLREIENEIRGLMRR